MATLSKADQTYLSASQQQEILALKKAWERANAAGDEAGKKAANQQAEAIRASAGYQGGADGTGYTKVNTQAGGQSAQEVQKWVDNYEYTNYDAKNGWVNGYSSEMNLRSMANYIRQQMQANSDAWAAADEATRDYLHDQNVQLAEILREATGGATSTYNAETGRWETDNANLGYGYNVGQYNDLDWYKNFYRMTDEQIEAYRSDTSRYRNYVDQSLIRNWVDESSGYTGIYSQFVNGPYGQLLSGSKATIVNPTVYKDVIGDGFNEVDYTPQTDAQGNIVPRTPALKNNNSMTDYTRQFASYVDENGVIQPGTLLQANPAGARRRVQTTGSGSVGTGSGGSTGGSLDAWRQAAEQQAVNARDYAVDQAVAQLLQAEAEAMARFQTQRDQIEGETLNALDNSALYAETRGDRGGIGQAQYNTIQATAAQNRQAVNLAQSQLTAETAQQAAQLRAQGEFEKADDLLEIAQTYLLKLLEMEQWAAEYQLDTAKFQASLYQWQQEFQLSAAKALAQKEA